MSFKIHFDITSYDVHAWRKGVADKSLEDFNSKIINFRSTVEDLLYHKNTKNFQKGFMLNNFDNF